MATAEHVSAPEIATRRPSSFYFALLSGAVVIVLGIALLVWISMLSNRVGTANAHISSLKHRLASDEQHQQASNAAQVTALKARVTKLQARTKLYDDCFPELQTQVSSETYDSNSGIISPNVQVSRECSSLLYGYGTGN